MMDIVLIGMNHTTAPLEVRERLSIACNDDGETCERLKGISEVKEALYLSTCNRVEVLARVGDHERALAGLKAFILSHGNLSPAELARCLYVHHDEDAVRHVFRVAASLDSMVMGEPQILGQVKDAYRRAVECETSGVILNRLFHHAFRVAKRVRTETGIAGNAVSVSATAVELAKKIVGDLAQKTALLVGAGEMAELAARHLHGKGIGKLIFANRNHDRALEFARDFGGAAVPFDRFEHALDEADIVISSTGAPGYVIREDMVAAALRRRRSRLLFLIDIAVPRDIDPAVGSIDNVYLYNIDDLQEVVDENVKGRREEAQKAEAIVLEEVGNFARWFKGLEVVPTIVDLRSKIDAITAGELEKSSSWMKTLDSDDKKNVEILIDSIINKILHDPVTGLREESENGGANPYVAVIKRLFRLERDEEDVS